MVLTITLLDKEHEKIWDELVISSPHGTIFHTIEWLRLVKEQTKSEFAGDVL